MVGRIPLVDVDAGAPITHRYFKEGNILAKVIPAGHQALALEVNEVIAAGGFVRPGDQVDVPGIHTTEPTFGLPATWVDASLKEEASLKG